MPEQNDTLIDVAKAIGFVLVVVFGGIFIAGDGYTESRDASQMSDDEPQREAD